MHSLPNRRQWIIGSGAALALPLSGCSANLRDLRITRLPDALAEMQNLLSAPKLTSHTAWSWGKTLEHLAQSVEYSMSGYPTQKSALFQQLLGGPAFGLFSWRGQMRHDLTEPIPGSPALADDPALEQAALRLSTACQRFMQWTGALEPHFAYGTLSHAEYEQAHAMHLANHFAAFEAHT